MIIYVLIFVLNASQPPILNYKDYVVAYSRENEDLEDIKSFMDNHELSFLDINIDKTPDVKKYLLDVYGDEQTRVYFNGNYLGLFPDFKRHFIKELHEKEQKKNFKDNVKGKKRIKMTVGPNKNLYIYTNDPQLEVEQNSINS